MIFYVRIIIILIIWNIHQFSKLLFNTLLFLLFNFLNMNFGKSFLIALKEINKYILLKFQMNRCGSFGCTLICQLVRKWTRSIIIINTRFSNIYFIQIIFLGPRNAWPYKVLACNTYTARPTLAPDLRQTIIE